MNVNIEVILLIVMADEIRELMSKKDEVEKEIKENLDFLQSVCVMSSTDDDIM